MARKSRQEYANASGAFGVKQAQPVEQGKEVPDKPCGLCANFSETAFTSDGRGACRKLKEGSNILVDPPVYVLEGKNGYMIRALTDAVRCQYYEKMKFVDKDGYECSDPQYKRTMRQFQDK